MRKQEFEDMGERLWPIFAAASMSRGAKPSSAASDADEMMKEFEKRFVKDDDN